MNLLLKTAISGIAYLVIGCAAVPSNNSVDPIKEKAQKVAEYIIQNNVADPRYENLPPELSDAVIRSARTYHYSQELGNKSYFMNLLSIDAAIYGMHIIVMESDGKKNDNLVSLLDVFVDGSCDNGVMMSRKEGVNGLLMEYSTNRDLGLGHKDTFQGIYEDVLDELLSAHEK